MITTQFYAADEWPYGHMGRFYDSVNEEYSGTIKWMSARHQTLLIVMVVWMTVYRYEVDDEYTIDTFEFYVSISESFFDITIQCRLSFTALVGWIRYNKNQLIWLFECNRVDFVDRNVVDVNDMSWCNWFWCFNLWIAIWQANSFETRIYISKYQVSQQIETDNLNSQKLESP